MSWINGIGLLNSALFSWIFWPCGLALFLHVWIIWEKRISNCAAPVLRELWTLNCYWLLPMLFVLQPVYLNINSAKSKTGDIFWIVKFLHTLSRAILCPALRIQTKRDNQDQYIEINMLQLNWSLSKSISFPQAANPFMPLIYGSHALISRKLSLDKDSLSVALGAQRTWRRMRRGEMITPCSQTTA